MSRVKIKVDRIKIVILEEFNGFPDFAGGGFECDILTVGVP